ncbi:MAG: dihydroorotate dehydrogenase electron transfer subunit [Pirellulales bacterium]|nr:dihydroorotate dehydrogenase electron transfer subunit [Pirellulales bacterium]
MSTPTYADHAWHGAATIAENERIARDTYRVRFACGEIARRVLPGQFVMLRLAGRNDPLLGRPLAVYDAIDDEGGNPLYLDVVYLVVGKMTGLLAEMSVGGRLEVWGPLGNGFPPCAVEHLVMVAGGIGQTPFLTLARERSGRRSYGDPPRIASAAEKITLLYGVRGGEYLAGVDDFRAAGIDVRLSTDDGSVGHRGMVTELIAPTVERSKLKCRLVCCGPEPMLEAAARIARELNVPCQVSLESPMACGVGVCFSCVKRIRDAEGRWDYRRACVEGPVFDAADVQF